LDSLLIGNFLLDKEI